MNQLAAGGDATPNPDNSPTPGPGASPGESSPVGETPPLVGVDGRPATLIEIKRD